MASRHLERRPSPTWAPTGAGGTVTTTTTAPLPSQGPGAYVFGAGGGQITFDVPITSARFFFIHQTGQGPFTARAFDASNNEVAMVSSNLLSNPSNTGNFEMLTGAAITRIEFTGGHVDNFFFQAQAIQPGFQINQDTDTVTVTPPSGFVGWMAVRVVVQQNAGVPVDANPPTTDEQVIRIRVMPAGTSAAMAASMTTATSTRTRSTKSSTSWAQHRDCCSNVTFASPFGRGSDGHRRAAVVASGEGFTARRRRSLTRSIPRDLSQRERC